MPTGVQPTEPAEAGPLEGDVVPGDPPVPITVWHLPRPPAGMVASGALVRRLVVNYTSPGATVVDLTTMPRHRFTESVDLIISGWPTTPASSPDQHLADCAAWLTDGGCVAVVLAVTETPDHLGLLVVAARAAGLTYLQHVVAAHHLGHHLGHRGVEPSPDILDGEPRRRDRSRHLRVHTDLLIFRRRSQA
jgi:hypothetical protein